MGECHNKRRGVITDLSVLPPSAPRTIYISEIKTWPGKMSVFCSIQKKGVQCSQTESSLILPQD